jgi:chemotaxis protein methyltransferase CheR
MVLKSSEFKKIRSIVHDYCGINLHEGKQALVRARVMKRIRKLGMRSFSQYVNYMKRDCSGSEFLALVDVLTTNKTSFFRESQHFDFIRDHIIPQMGTRRMKWWSAGCSTGQEPVSCAIALREQNVSKEAVKILGTDLSREVVHAAKTGVYGSEKVVDLPDRLRDRYFEETKAGGYRVVPDIRSMIAYGRLNLKKKWPLNGPFHVIMCRNVMIYFNRRTQQELVSRFYDILEPGGYLFLGHSESVSGRNSGFQNIRPAVYQKQ